MFHQTTYDWQYKTVPQKYSCMAMVKNSSHWTSGKGWGGSQILNNMILFNDNDNDVDNDDDDDLIQTINNQEKYETIYGKQILLAAKEFGYRNNEFFRPNFTQKFGKRYTSGNYYLDKQKQYCTDNNNHCNNHQIIFYATVSLHFFFFFF